MTFRLVFLKVQNYLNDIRFSVNEGQMVYKQILFSKRQNNLLKKKASISKTKGDWQDFKIARNSYNKLVKASISQYYTGEISKNKGNAKNTWKTINDLINKSKKIFKRERNLR